MTCNLTFRDVVVDNAMAPLFGGIVILPDITALRRIGSENGSRRSVCKRLSWSTLAQEPGLPHLLRLNRFRSFRGQHANCDTIPSRLPRLEDEQTLHSRVGAGQWVRERPLSGKSVPLRNDRDESALLPNGFALSEWPVLTAAVVQSPIDKRRILVESRPAHCWDRTAASLIMATTTGQAADGSNFAIVSQL